MASGVRPRRARRTFDAIALTVVAALSTGAVLEIAFAVEHPDELAWYRVVSLSYTVVGVLVYVVVARAVVRHDPRQPVGWLLVVLMLSGAASVLSNGYTAWELPASAGVNWVAWPLRATMFPALAVAFTLFPTGRPLPRWRWLTWTCAGAGAVGAVVAAIAPWPFPPYPNDTYFGENPLAADGLDGAPAAIEALGPLLVLVALSTLVVRFRRAEGIERDQIKVIGAAALLILLAAVSAATAAATGDVDSTEDEAVNFLVGDGIFNLLIVGLAVAMGVGIVRYRLYGIERLMSRTLTYAVLVAVLGAAYAATVAAASTALSGDGPSLLASIAVAAMVTTAFQPLRRRVQRWIERRVFGRRAEAHEVITDFARTLAAAPAAHTVLEQIASTTRDVAGAASARATVLLPDGTETSATAGATSAAWDRVVPVHDGERIGELAVTAGDRRPRDGRLLERIVDVAAPAMVAVRLDAELDASHATIQDRNREIAASRQRLVEAAEHERDRFRAAVGDRITPDLRMIQDASADLRAIVETDPNRVAGRCAELVPVATRVIREVRSLSRGVLPPVLADHGLAAAVRAELRRLPISGEVQPIAVTARFDPQVEAVAFLCCRAFLADATNASAHSATIVIRADAAADQLHVMAHHDGAAIHTEDVTSALLIEQDRLGAFGGELRATDMPKFEIHARIPLDPGRSQRRIAEGDPDDQLTSARTTSTA